MGKNYLSILKKNNLIIIQDFIQKKKIKTLENMQKKSRKKLKIRKNTYAENNFLKSHVKKDTKKYEKKYFEVQ